MAASTGNSIEIGHSDQELVGSGKRNLKRYLLLGTIAVIALAVAAALIVILTNDDDEESPDSQPIVSPGDPITLDDYLAGKFSAGGYSGSWTPSGKILHRNEYGSVLLYDPEQNTTATLLGPANEELLQGFKFDLSPEEDYLLVSRGYSKIFRHSYLAVYDIVELQTHKVIPILVQGERKALNLVEWAPVGNSLIFVYQNNIYYKSSPEADEVQVTTDGSPSVYNGIPDWVYEEEVFSTNIATWWSPDAGKIAFIRFIDTETPIMKIPIYGPPGNPEFQYPHELSLHYPKVGTKNPEVHLFQYDLAAKQMQEIAPPTELVTAERDHIITSVGWATNDRVISIWKNRVQNRAIIRSCSEQNVCITVQNINAAGGWLELFSAPVFNADGSQFLLLTSQDQTAGDAFKHITMVSSTVATSVALTSGKFVVQDILKWDSNNLIFYTANTEQESHVLHIYAVRGQQGATPQCLTCTLDTVSRQSFYNAQLSPKAGKYIVLEARGPNIPWSYVYGWTADSNGVVSLTPVKAWETNVQVEEQLKKKAMPEVQIHDVDLGNGFIAKAMLLVPPGFDASGRTKYPMIVDVYGGPNSANVVGTWSISWGTHLASNRSVVYAKIDGRGCGLRGDRMLYQIYRKLGTVEIEDQIAASKKLSEQLPFIDRNRMAIWGWSYGGYASAMALAKDTEHVFQCAVSVAPVTDWLFYDSIYTERYMGLPRVTDNQLGYEQSRLTALYENFRNRSYLLVHGTYDDNVHFQQAMQLSRALETHDIMFKQVSYPDEDHSLAGVRPHLYHTLGKFFTDCLHLD